MIRTALLTAIALCAASDGLRARAQGAPSGPDCIPDVTTERRERARAFVKSGFARHEELRFAEAARLYARALTAWDHPETRFALARVLFFEARLLEAHEHLRAALRCAAFLESDDDRIEATNLMNRLQGQLARIEVQTPDRDTEILFNGAPWFTGASTRIASKMVYPGQYVITAKRPGHVTVRKSLELAPSDWAIISPSLVSVADATTIKRKWPRWQPWAVVGAGVLSGLVGVGMDRWAGRQFEGFDRAWAAACGGDSDVGCSEDDVPSLVAMLRSAERKRRVAIGAFALGGAALLTGAVWLALNRPKSYLNESASTANMTVTPMVSRDSAGFSAGFRF